jgi:hypothetical protein
MSQPRRATDTRIQTFEQRGIHIPFRHPYLTGTRLRHHDQRSPDAWETLIPDLNDRRLGQVLTVPWRQLPTIATLDPYDQMLFARITELGMKQGLDPQVIRLLRLSIIREHSAKAAERDAARDEMDADAAERAATISRVYATVVHGFATAQGLGTGSWTTIAGLDAMLRGGTAADDPSLNAVFARMAQSHDISRTGLARRVEALASLIVPYCGILANELTYNTGIVTRIYGELRIAHGDLADIVKAGGFLYCNVASTALFAVGEFINFIGRRLNVARGNLGHLADIIHSQPEVMSLFTGLGQDLVHAVDGWEILLAQWQGAMRQVTMAAPDREAGYLVIKNALLRLLVQLPLLPANALADDDGNHIVWDHYNSLRTGAVCEMQEEFEAIAELRQQRTLQPNTW